MSFLSLRVGPVPVAVCRSPHVVPIFCAGEAAFIFSYVNFMTAALQPRIDKEFNLLHWLVVPGSPAAHLPLHLQFLCSAIRLRVALRAAFAVAGHVSDGRSTRACGGPGDTHVLEQAPHRHELVIL